MCIDVLAVKKPSFTEMLRDSRAREGEGVTLECRFTGEPPPHVQWLHNDKQILPSAVFKVICICISC